MTAAPGAAARLRARAARLLRRTSGPLRLAASLALLALAFRAVDGEAALARLAGAEPAPLLAAFVALHLQTWASAERWRLTAERLGHRFGLGRAAAEYYLAQLLNQTLPGGVLGDAGRAARASVEAGLGRASGAVALERLAGQAGLAALAAPAFAVAATLALFSGRDTAAAGFALALGALLCAAAGAALAARALASRPGRLGELLRSAGHALLAREVRARQAALSLATAALNVAAFALCVRAVDPEASLAAAAAVAPLVLGAMLLPLSIAGWGLREAAAAALWPLVGGAAQVGVAAGVAFGLVFLATALPGLVPLLRRSRAPVPGAGHSAGAGSALR